MRRTRALAPRGPFTGEVFDEFDRLFEGLPHDLWSPFPGLRTLGRWGSQAPVDLRDEGEAFVLKMDLPGVLKDQVQIEVDESGAEIRTTAREEREESGEGYLLRERHEGAWLRRIPFPAEVVAEKVEAQLEDGVLSIRFPKAEPAERRKAHKVVVK